MYGREVKGKWSETGEGWPPPLQNDGETGAVFGAPDSC